MIVEKFAQAINKLPAELILNMKACEQNLKYHPEITLYNHTEQVYNKAYEFGNNDLCLVSIFHDLGKIDTTTLKNRKDGSTAIVSYGHEFKSLKYLNDYLELYEYENKELIYWIVENHMRIHLYNTGAMSNPNKRKALETHQWFDLLVQFSEFDSGGKVSL